MIHDVISVFDIFEISVVGPSQLKSAITYKIVVYLFFHNRVSSHFHFYVSSGKTTDLNTTDSTGTAEINSKPSTTSLSQEALKKAAEKPPQEKVLPQSESNTSSNDNSKSPTELLLQGVAAGVERTPGDGMDNKINKDLFQSTINIVTNNNNNPPIAPQVIPKQIDDQITKEEAKIDQLEQSEVQLIPATKKLVIGDSVSGVHELKDQQDSTSIDTDNKKTQPQPYFESSDVVVESKHLLLSRHVDIDVVKSLPSNLNSVSAASTHPMQHFQKSSTMAALQHPLHSNSPDVASSSDMGVASPPSNQTADTPSMEQQNFYEAEQQPTPSVEPTPGVYEPFSRSAWPVGGFGGAPVSGTGGGCGLGGSRFKSLWSEATLDNEKVFFSVFFFLKVITFNIRVTSFLDVFINILFFSPLLVVVGASFITSLIPICPVCCLLQRSPLVLYVRQNPVRNGKSSFSEYVNGWVMKSEQSTTKHFLRITNVYGVREERRRNNIFGAQFVVVVLVVVAFLFLFLQRSLN